MIRPFDKCGAKHEFDWVLLTWLRKRGVLGMAADWPDAVETTQWAERFEH